MALRQVRGSTVVITGATSGIGRETAREFARAGARVVAAGRREDRLRELVAEIEGQGGSAFAVGTDVTTENRTGLDMASVLPKFPARELARIIVQDARVPQPEIVMALDAQVLDFRRGAASGRPGEQPTPGPRGG